MGYAAADFDELAKLYDPERLRYGFNTMGGEEVFYIPNPALGLWIDRERFNHQENSAAALC